MRLAPSPGADAWMVRVTLSRWTTPTNAYAYRYTAVDLDADDPTPGVYPTQFELGRMERPHHTAPWSVRLQRIEARNDEEAREIAAAVYDAARGFLALGLAPTPTEPTALEQPYRLTIEIGDDRWSFPTTAAPAEGWAVLRAAERMTAPSAAA